MLLLSIRNLDPASSAEVLGKGVSPIGILLLTPLFIPESRNNVLETVLCRSVTPIRIVMIRLLMSAVCILVLIIGFMGAMRFGSCQFDFWKYFIGTAAAALFLGGIGFAVSSLTTAATGYLAAVLCYLLNYFAGSRLGWMYLFSFLENGMEQKIVLLAGAFAMVLIGLFAGRKRIMNH